MTLVCSFQFRFIQFVSLSFAKYSKPPGCIALKRIYHARENENEPVPWHFRVRTFMLLDYKWSLFRLVRLSNVKKWPREILGVRRATSPQEFARALIFSCLVTWPMTTSEAGVDRVLIQTSWLFSC